ncbi:MAG: pentapeptide repeat-containing protein [Cetobacterium sp.]
MIKILHRQTGAVLREVDAGTLAGANLAGAYLAGANLADAYLADAYLAGADLADAYLAGADLAGADLAGANLAGAYLAGANLAGATVGGHASHGRALLGDIKADPTLPARVAAAAIAPNALDMGNWHTCGTTHCLGGWAITLSGPAGRALEKTTSSSVAAAMLLPSVAHLFYASNEEALMWARAQLAGAAA